MDSGCGGTPAKLLTHPWAKNLLGGVFKHFYFTSQQNRVGY